MTADNVVDFKVHRGDSHRVRPKRKLTPEELSTDPDCERDLFIVVEAARGDFLRMQEEGLYASPWGCGSYGLHGLPWLKDRTALEVMDILTPILARLNPDPDADPWTVLGTKDTFGAEVYPEDDFLHAWDRVSGPHILEDAVLAARRANRPDDFFGENFSHGRLKRHRHFLSVAFELAKLRKGKPFKLPVKKLAPLLYCRHPQQVSRWLGFATAKDHEFLRCLKPADHNAGKAAEYIWLWERSSDSL